MREAAKQDYPPALYNLGALTEHETQSLQYYKKSAELGYAPAQRYLALCHLNA
jgi:TPR repeat protein